MSKKANLSALAMFAILKLFHFLIFAAFLLTLVSCYLLHKVQKVQVSDTTKDEKSTTVDKQKNIITIGFN